MRLFVALEVPEGPRREAARRVEAARGALPPAHWVDLATLHLTLVFLGEVDGAHGSGPSGLAAGLARACAPHRPVELRLAGGGTFPPRRPARVAWMGIEAGRELAALQADVARAAGAALAGSGYEPETRPYHPHVTLARCADPWPPAAAEAFAAAFAGPIGEPFAAARALLVESRLGAGGARHREAASFPLQGAERA